MKRNRKKRLLWLLSILTVFVITVTAFGIYSSDYYHADYAAISAFSESTSVTKTYLADDIIAYSPESESAKSGLIFYPGGKVEYTAYVSKKTDNFDGLILLASYSTADLSETGLPVLSVYGSEDKVLNQEKYEKYKTNLPADFSESILDGGCHAYFGMYGEQAGDGIPTLKNVEQIKLTANKISEFIN